MNEKYEDLKALKKKIEESSKKTWIKIYQIVKKNNEKCVTNKNGIFFDIENLDIKTIREIYLLFRL